VTSQEAKQQAGIKAEKQLLQRSETKIDGGDDGGDAAAATARLSLKKKKKKKKKKKGSFVRSSRGIESDWPRRMDLFPKGEQEVRPM